MNKKFVLDTNVLISAFLNQDSKPFLAFKKAKEFGTIVISEDTLNEFRAVLLRPKFDKYLSPTKRVLILRLLSEATELVSVKEVITDCRDPKDNKFLELAVATNASCLITGDNDLLVLHPFRTIPILNASEFLSLTF